MAFNVLSGSITNYDLIASGSFSGSFQGDGGDLTNVRQFDVQNQGDQRLLFYKLVNGVYQLNANSGLIFNDSANVLSVNGPKVGIGTTNPDALLDLKGNGTADSEVLRLSLDGDRDWSFAQEGSGAGTGLRLRSLAAKDFYIDATAVVYRNHDGSGEIMRIEPANGKVGIGTANPDALLDLKGNGSADNEVLRFGLDGDRDWSFAQEGTGAATGLRLRSLAAKDFYIDATAVVYRNHDGTGEVMRIEPANGKVGIGTDSPSAKLEIIGNLKVSTSLTASTVKLTGLALGTATTASFLALDSNNNIVLTSSAGGSGGGGISYSRRFISAHATASTGDVLIGISASAPLELRLPSAGGYTAGQYFTVKDEAGNCNTFNITIKTTGSETIDGQSSVMLESPFAAVNIYANGTNKFFIY